MFKKVYLIPLNYLNVCIVVSTAKKKILIGTVNNQHIILVTPYNSKLDFESNYIIYKKSYNDLSNIIWFNNLINTQKFFLKTFSYFFLKKIKYKGKGFKIKNIRKRKIKKFLFGKAHLQLFFVRSILWKNFSKRKFFLIYKNKKRLIYTSIILKSFKKYNKYTLRGIREVKQIIYKRKGRKSVSNYI